MLVGYHVKLSSSSSDKLNITSLDVPRCISQALNTPKRHEAIQLEIEELFKNDVF